MTPTHTGAVPQLHDDDPIDEPRTGTVAYFADGRQWGTPLAEPAPAHDLHLTADDLITALDRERNEHQVTVLRLEEMTGLLAQANRDASAALARERSAGRRADKAEARLELLQMERASALDRALDSVCRELTGGSHAALVAELDRQVAEHPDPDEDDTVVVDPDELEDPPEPDPAALDRIALVIRRVRATGANPTLVQLADLVEALQRAERVLERARQRAGRTGASLADNYPAVVVVDTYDRALSRAVRR